MRHVVPSCAQGFAGEFPRGAARRARLVLPLILLLTAACVARPAEVQTVLLESRTFGFMEELLEGGPGTAEQVDAVLALPTLEGGAGEAGAGAVPALVLLHTSNGQGSQDWLYLKRLRNEGIAVLAIDSFTRRGVSHTVRDQTLVSSASMLADAYAGLAFLSADRRIDSRRIGVMGFSKGGIAALYAAYRPFQRRASIGGEGFALHIAYYPWCGLRLHQAVTTGAPVLIQVGALDDLVPPERCAELIEATRGPQGPNRMRLVVHPGARHAFDHPLLSIFGNLPVSAPSPASCTLKQQADGSFVELHSARGVNQDNLSDVLAGCSRGGHAGGNEAAAAAAYANTLAFLRAEGFLPL